MRRLIPVLVCAMAACATAGPPADTGGVSERIVMSEQFNVVHTLVDKTGREASVLGTVKQVQSAIVATYSELQLDLNTVDLEAGLYGATSVALKRELAGVALSTYVDCGRSFSGARANSDKVTLTVLTRVKSDGKGTVNFVTNIQEATALDITGGNARESAMCGSNGTLEGKINAMIQTKVLGK